MKHSGRWLCIFSFCVLAACGAPDEPGASVDDASVPPKTPDPGGRGTGQEIEPVPASASAAPANEHVAELPRKSGARVERRNASDLISDLQELSWNEDQLEEAAVNELLSQLRSQGADAVVPIRDFLLDEPHSGDTLNVLRQALLDVLFGLGLPEVEDVVLELLAAGPPASEMWQLGAYLETVNPGTYSEVIRSAAELVMEANPGVLLPPEFFLLLGELGNAQTAVLLGQAPPHQEAYAGLTLAELGDDSGLPILAEQARAFEAGRDTVQGRLAVQLLAQRAAQSPSAAAVLLELAERGVIPPDLWPHILDLVAGNWEFSLVEPPTELQVGSHTYYRPEGDQIIWRVARPPYGADDGLQAQRLYLLDRLQALIPEGLGLSPDG